MIITAFCLMVTTHDWISGTGSIISCLHKGPIPENVINSYCYIMGTFSVPKHYVDFDTQIGFNVAGTGVGPYVPKEDFIEVKSYYQWVPFVLFLQAIMFYMPHVIFKSFEGGKIKLIIAGLHQWVMDKNERHSKEMVCMFQKNFLFPNCLILTNIDYQELAKYILLTRGTHNSWCYKLLFAQCLYLVRKSSIHSSIAFRVLIINLFQVNVIGQIFFTDCFLGYEFSLYGVSAVSLLEEKPEDRIDPVKSAKSVHFFLFLSSYL